jgi:hypothetical protein
VFARLTVIAHDHDDGAGEQPLVEKRNHPGKLKVDGAMAPA